MKLSGLKKFSVLTTIVVFLFLFLGLRAVYTQEGDPKGDPNLQLDTFTPTPTPPPPPEEEPRENPPPQEPPPPPPAESTPSCIPKYPDSFDHIEVIGGETFGYIVQPSPPLNPGIHWFWIPTEDSTTQKEIDKALEALAEDKSNKYITYDPPGLGGSLSSQCPVPLTSFSPTLFI